MLEKVIEDYDDLVGNLLSSNHSTFESRLKQFFAFVDADPVKSVMDTLPDVDFDEWYKSAKSTVGSFVGSGNLDWPTDLKENTSMHVSLLRKISEGQFSVPDFCVDFLYSENNFNVMVMDFNEQIVSPVTSDIRKMIVRSLREPAGKPSVISSEEKSTPHWYQRPVGMIGIGLLVTILGGVAVSKLLSVL